MAEVKVAILLVLSCLGFPIRPSDTADTVYLSMGETALLDASSYFVGPVSDFDTHGKAEILDESAVKETIRVNIDTSDWRLGSALKYSGIVYFAVLGTDWVEVWRWMADRVVKDSRVSMSRQVAKATHVHSSTPGFVLSTAPPIEVFFLPILSPSQLTPLGSIDTAGAAHLSVCSALPELAVVRQTAVGAELTFYDIDYRSLLIQRRLNVLLLSHIDPVIDTECHEVYAILTPFTLYTIDASEVSFRDIESSMGAAIRLQSFYHSSLFSITTEKGAVLRGSSHTFPELFDGYFPNAIFATQANSHHFRIELWSGSWHLVASDSSLFKDASRYWSFRLNSAVGGVLWLHSWSIAADFAMLVKEGSELVGLELTIKGTYAIVTALGAPFTFALCAVDQLNPANSACRNITIVSVPYEDPVVLLNDTTPLALATNATIAVDVIVEERFGQYLFDRSKWLSGANLNHSVMIPALPTGVQFSIHELTSMEADSDAPFPPKVDGFQYLCRSYTSLPQYVFSHDSLLLVFVSRGDEVQIISMNQTVAMCVVEESLLCVCGIDAQGNGSVLCSFVPLGFTPQSVESPCIALKTTETHVIAVLQSGVAVMDKVSRQWSRVHTHSEDPLTGVWANDYSFIIRSRRSLELFEWRSQGFISTLLESVPAGISHLAYFGSTLLTATDEECALYHISTARQLIKRFSLPTLCQVADVAISSVFAFLRCSDHIQIISPSFKSRSAKVAQIPRTNLHGSLSVVNDELMEVYCSDNGCRKTSWPTLVLPLSYYLLFRLHSDSIPMRILSFAGELLVTSSKGEQATIPLNFTLHNYDGISILPFASRVEVPWDQAYSLPLSALFSGHSLSFHATGSQLVGLEITNRKHLILELPGKVPPAAIAGESNLTFTCIEYSCVVGHFTCNAHNCFITTQRMIELLNRQVSIKSVQVFFSANSLVFLRVTCREYIQTTTINHFIGIIVYDTESQQFEIIKTWPESQRPPNYHIIRISTSETRVFFFSSTLQMCTVVGKSCTCTDVSEMGLEAVVSVSSEQLSPSAWNVYFLTDHLVIYQYLMADTFIFQRNVTASVLNNAKVYKTELIGTTLISLKFDEMEVYSLPGIALLSTVPLHHPIDIEGWKISTTGRSRFIAISHGSKKVTIISIESPTHPEVVFKCPSYFLQFTSPTDIAYITGETLNMVKLSQAVLTLQRNESAVDTVESEVSITATNGHISVSCSLHVLRTGRESYTVLVLGLIGAVVIGCVLTWKWRRGKRTVKEVEMEAISLGGNR